MKSIASNLALCLLSVFLVLLAIEVGLSLGISATDTDVEILGKRIPVNKHATDAAWIQSTVEQNTQHGDSTRLLASTSLGWTHRPGYSWHELYSYNSAGIRSAREYPKEKPSDTLRIAVFGDSFTHGDEVRHADTWSYRLERHLNEARLRTEILNFGVGGYGVDQAYLRWQEEGRHYRPDIVILGLAVVDYIRHESIFRALLLHRLSPLPFTKPRYLMENNDLRLINFPAIGPSGIVTAFSDLSPASLIHQDRYALPPFSSRIAEIVTMARLAPPTLDDIRKGTPMGDLGTRIVQQFGRHVQNEGSHFIVAHMIGPAVMKYVLEERRYPFEAIYEDIRSEFPFVQSEESLTMPWNTMWAPHGHPNRHVTSIVAADIAQSVVDCVQSSRCFRPDAPGDNAYFESPAHRGSVFKVDLAGTATRAFRMKAPDGIWVAADWDGDGTDEFGVVDVQDAVLRTLTRTGVEIARHPMRSSPEAVALIAGDWNGDGRDTPGYFDNQTLTFILFKSIDMDEIDRTIVLTGDYTKAITEGQFLPLSGDWNGDGSDQVGFYERDKKRFHFNTSPDEFDGRSMRFGPAAVPYEFESPWQIVIGDWDGDRVDTPGFYNADYGWIVLAKESRTRTGHIRAQFTATAHPGVAVAGTWVKGEADSLMIHVP